MPACRSAALETLGLSAEADHRDIRRAFRKLSRQYHPDLGGDATHYQAITTAYAYLTDSHTAAQQSPHQRTAEPASANGTATASRFRTQRPKTSSAGTSQPQPPSRTPSGPAHQTVTYEGAHPHYSASDARTHVRGDLRRRNFLDRKIYRNARREALEELFARIHRHVPAARMALGVRAGGENVEAVIFAGQRLLAVSVNITTDAEHTWDGVDLRAGGRPLKYQPNTNAVPALERTVGGTRAETLDVLFVPGHSAQHPVIRRVGATGTVQGPAPIARAAGEGIAYLAGGPNPSSVFLNVYGTLMDSAKPA